MRKIESTWSNVKADVVELNYAVQRMQRSGGTLSDADEASLGEIQRRGEAIAGKVEWLLSESAPAPDDGPVDVERTPDGYVPNEWLGASNRYPNGLSDKPTVGAAGAGSSTDVGAIEDRELVPGRSPYPG